MTQPAQRPSRLFVDAARGTVVSDQWVPGDLESVFAFFSDAYNLERLTPAFLNFRILSMSTPQIAEGTEIHYRLRVRGIPFGWTSRITDWSRPASFTDIQISGPYRFWHHRHLFEREDGGTWVRDRVHYRPPLGRLGLAIAGGFVSADIERIFRYRQQVIRGLFGKQEDVA